MMCRRIGLTKIGLTKLCFKDLYFLSRTFADLPNVRGDSQKSKTPGRPSKPPDLSPAQQKGKISHNCRFKYLLWHTDGPSSVEQQSDGSSSPVVRPPEPVLPDIRSLSSSLKNKHFSGIEGNFAPFSLHLQGSRGFFKARLWHTTDSSNRASTQAKINIKMLNDHFFN